MALLSVTGACPFCASVSSCSWAWSGSSMKGQASASCSSAGSISQEPPPWASLGEAMRLFILHTPLQTSRLLHFSLGLGLCLSLGLSLRVLVLHCRTPRRSPPLKSQYVGLPKETRETSLMQKHEVALMAELGVNMYLTQETEKSTTRLGS